MTPWAPSRIIIVYEENATPGENLPVAVMVRFDHYSGPGFPGYDRPGCPGVVPIIPYTATHEGTGRTWTQIPLDVAHGMTPSFQLDQRDFVFFADGR